MSVLPGVINNGAKPVVAVTAKGVESPSYKWWVIFMLWFVCFFNYADRQAISSVLPLLGRDFGFGPVQLGLIGSAFAWVYAAAAPVAGVAADRRSRKRLIVAACIVWSVFTLATAGCGNISTFVIVRALTGLAETIYFPAAMSLISDYHSRQTRSRAMSWHQSAVYAGTILGSWLAAVLAERSGWRVPFILFGPLGIVLALGLTGALREPRRGEAEVQTSNFELQTSNSQLPVADTLRLIVRTPAAMLLMGGFLCANFVAMIFLTWTPTFLVEKFHYGLGVAGLTGVVYIHLASAMAVPVAGWLADRWSQRFAAGRVGVQAAGLLLGSFFVFAVARTASPTTLVVTMAVFGVCKGFYDSGIFASLYDTIEPRARGAAAGLMNTIGWGGGALGALFVGLVMQYGRKPTRVENMSDAIACGGFVYLVGLLLLGAAIWMFRNSGGQRRAEPAFIPA